MKASIENFSVHAIAQLLILPKLKKNTLIWEDEYILPEASRVEYKIWTKNNPGCCTTCENFKLKVTHVFSKIRGSWFGLDYSGFQRTF